MGELAQPLATNSSNGGSQASATLAAVAPAWALSGAPMGDVSANNYPASWARQTLPMSSVFNGNFTVSNVTGAPSGIHVYQVNSVPNATAGIRGLRTNNIYFGTFLANGTSPTYKAVYDYSLYPDALINENTDALYLRAYNSVSAWSAAAVTLNTVIHTLTLTGVTVRDEFVIGNTNVPLPIDSISFKVSHSNNTNSISWKVLEEKNVSYYQLEKSNDGITFNTLSKIPSESKSMNSYLFSDNTSESPIIYYRLKIIFGDESIQNSTIISCNNDHEIISFYPQPFREYLVVELSTDYSEISILDLNGHIVYTIQHVP